MINKNLFIIVCVVIVLINIIALAYLENRTHELREKIVELESSREQSLDIIYPKSIDENISTNLSEIDMRIRAIEDALDQNIDR